MERSGGRDFLGHRSYVCILTPLTPTPRVLRHPDVPGPEQEADGSRGDYQWIKYKDAHEEIVDIGCGLAQLVTGKAGAGPGSQPRVGTYSINRPECTKVMLALWSQRFICSPLYDTLGVLARPTHRAICCPVCAPSRVGQRR